MHSDTAQDPRPDVPREEACILSFGENATDRKQLQVQGRCLDEDFFSNPGFGLGAGGEELVDTLQWDLNSTLFEQVKDIATASTGCGLRCGLVVALGRNARVGTVVKERFDGAQRIVPQNTRKALRRSRPEILSISEIRANLTPQGGINFLVNGIGLFVYGLVNLQVVAGRGNLAAVSGGGRVDGRVAVRSRCRLSGRHRGGGLLRRCRWL